MEGTEACANSRAGLRTGSPGGYVGSLVSKGCETSVLPDRKPRMLMHRGGGAAAASPMWEALPVLLQGCLVSVGISEGQYDGIRGADWAREWEAWGDVRNGMNDVDIMNWTQRLVRIISQNGVCELAARSNEQRVRELREEGLIFLPASSHGQNNCLIDALQLTMAAEGFLSRELLWDTGKRRAACAACREQFVHGSDQSLRPRQLSELGQQMDVPARQHALAYLQADIHGPAAVLRYYARPDAEFRRSFRIVVYTRFDNAALDPVRMAIPAGAFAGSARVATLHLYNQMDSRGNGYHFDAFAGSTSTWPRGAGAHAEWGRAPSPTHRKMSGRSQHGVAEPSRAALQNALDAFLASRGAVDVRANAADVARLAAAWHRRDDLAGVLLSILQAGLAYADATRASGRKLAAEFHGFVAAYCAGPGERLGTAASASEVGTADRRASAAKGCAAVNEGARRRSSRVQEESRTGRSGAQHWLFGDGDVNTGRGRGCAF